MRSRRSPPATRFPPNCGIYLASRESRDGNAELFARTDELLAQLVVLVASDKEKNKEVEKLKLKLVSAPRKLPQGPCFYGLQMIRDVQDLS